MQRAVGIAVHRSITAKLIGDGLQISGRSNAVDGFAK